MKLKELIKLFEERQTICLIIDGWSITILKEALEYCANDKVLNGTVMKIAAEDATPIVVCASSADYEHDGCDGCQYENFDFTSEPCNRCRCCTGEPANDLYRPKEEK